MNSAGTIGGGNGKPYIAGFCIPIRHQAQHQQYDCWAACLAMISKFRGIEISCEQIFTAAPLHIPSYSYGQMATGAETNRVSKRMTDGKVTFTEITGVSTKDANYWMQHINKYKPVLTTIDNHCRILMGYNGIGQLIVMDPSPFKNGPEPIGIRNLQQNCRGAWVMD